MNKTTSKLIAIAKSFVLLPVLLLVFLSGWWMGLPPKASETQTESETIWTCSMHPQVSQPEPGLCPICQMDLIPLNAGNGSAGLRDVTVTPEAAALMNLRVSPVERRLAESDIHLFGKIDFDERRVTTVTARMAGRLDRFYVDFTGVAVREGDHMAEIYSPELYVAQQDLIKAVASSKAVTNRSPAFAQTQQRLLESARERLRLLELDDDQIAAIEKQTTPTDHITLRAPTDGLVIKRQVEEGQYVNTGAPLFAIADLTTVWLQMEAYESDLPWLRFAQDVEFEVEALPGQVFHGRIAYIQPELDARRRVVPVRVNVDNSNGHLKPGMFARARVKAVLTQDGRAVDIGLAGKWISPMHPEIMQDEPGQCSICGMNLVKAEDLGFIASAAGAGVLQVPAAAVLRTGNRALVYVREKAGGEVEFSGRQILLGPRVGDAYMVKAGLEEGEWVVTDGAFLLDSELQLQARPSLMNPDAGLAERPAAEAPAALIGQWQPVLRALGRNDPAQVRAAVAAIRTEALSDDIQARWKEFRGRFEVAVADLPQVTPREVERIGMAMGLPYQPIHLQNPLSEAERETLKANLTNYYALATALTKDDEAGARKTAAMLGPLGKPLLDAPDLESLRKAFDALSGLLADQIRASGDQAGNVFRVHCPMAFESAGASWLSPESTVLNPYFGEKMLRCGSVKETLSFSAETKPSKPKSADPHAHHRH